MKNLIDVILESRGQRISQRASNRPYDPNEDTLIKNKESRPQRAQELRETKTDKKVKELCSELANDFIVKFYKLNAKNKRIISFDRTIENMLIGLDRDGEIEDILPGRDGRYAMVVLGYYKSENYYTYSRKVVLQYNNSEAFSNVLNNFELKYISYKWDGYQENNRHESPNPLILEYDPKFLSSVLHKLRKHDLAKKAEKKEQINLCDLFNDLADKYNKNYFADKFKEFETAYNDVLANW